MRGPQVLHPAVERHRNEVIHIVAALDALKHLHPIVEVRTKWSAFLVILLRVSNSGVLHNRAVAVGESLVNAPLQGIVRVKLTLDLVEIGYVADRIDLVGQFRQPLAVLNVHLASDHVQRLLSASACPLRVVSDNAFLHADLSILVPEVRHRREANTILRDLDIVLDEQREIHVLATD